MGKITKILGAILVVVIVVTIVLYFVASRYLTPERIKAFIVPPLEEATGLKVSIGDIKRAGLFGVKVNQVKFLDPVVKKDVISADELRLSLKLSPLLKGKLVVSEVAFIRPYIFVIREKDGSINLTKYFAPEETAPTQETPPAQKEPAKLALIFQSIKIEAAKIKFVDQKKELPPAEGTFSLNGGLKLEGTSLVFTGDGQLNVKVDKYPLVEDLRFNALVRGKENQIKLVGGKILKGKVLGEIVLNEEKIKGLIRLSQASFKEGENLAKVLKPYLFPEAEIPALDGGFDVEITLAGTISKPIVESSVYPKPLKIYQKPYTIVAEGEIKASVEEVLPKINLTVNGEKFSINGKVSLKEALPRADLLISAQKLNLKALIPEGEKEAPEKPSQPEEKRVSQKKKASLVLPITGKIRFKAEEVCYQVCAKDARAEIVLNKERLDLKNFSFFLAGALAQVNGNVTNLSDTPKIKFAYSLAGADLPTLAQSFFSKSDYFASGKVWTEGAFSALGIEAEAVKKTLTGQGNARFMQLGLKENNITSLVAQVLRIEELKALKFDQGKLNYAVANGWVNVKGKFSREGLLLNLTGRVGLDGRLDLIPRLLFSGKYASLFAKNFPGASLFRTQKGYEVPLSIAGTLEKPKVSLKEVEEKVKEKVKEKAVKEIFKLLGQ
ncbi:AsmA family protein [Thermodesulfatator autotrophicus]|uniref:AsmA domain-containing protein n=1 Tax=Thermodesulfatator autotrophicus TaxID=1795632 RepID=A0A177ECH3_9BACT|nr:AsmA family protein [Thermodesulfatator autotrophicus]OAG28699.1 hypothetical protein TH606_00085 [Thermodesulfatator autotrophicus]